MTFGQKLLNLRNAKGWSQKDLAKEIGGISGSSVGAWENGAVPGLDAAYRAARVFEVPLDFLADDAQDYPPSPGSNDQERRILDVAREIGFQAAYRKLIKTPLELLREEDEARGRLVKYRPSFDSPSLSDDVVESSQEVPPLEGPR